ncbi:MAG: hypothetical protein WKG07_09235 [Hymenobacter sp.]
MGIRISGLLSAVSSTDVYYAFTDASNGALRIITPTGPLPVTLTSFGVRRLPGAAGAEISWATATEPNSSSFTVERSDQPGEGFVAIGQAAAAGTSNLRHSYTLHDADAATQAGLLYYRLRQLDADGHATLSPVAVLAAGSGGSQLRRLYPNPAPASAQAVPRSARAALRSLATRLISIRDQANCLVAKYSATPTLPPSAPPAWKRASTSVVLRDAGGRAISSQRLVIQ